MTDQRCRELLPVMVTHSRRLRKTMTEAEKKLWSHLQHKKLAQHKFRRQHPIGPYIVDFICIQRRLIIELDGGQHALQQAQDFARDTYLVAQEYRVLRFWNNEVMSNVEGVLSVILHALES